MVNYKSIFSARTFWLALAQAVVGVVVIALTEGDAVGAALIVKSLADVFLRMDTDTPVKL